MTQMHITQFLSTATKNILKITIIPKMSIPQFINNKGRTIQIFINN